MSNESTPQITVKLSRLLQIQKEINRLQRGVSALKNEQCEIETELAGCLDWDTLYLDPLLISQGYIAEVSDVTNGRLSIHFRQFECSLSAAKEDIQKAIAQIDS